MITDIPTKERLEKLHPKIKDAVNAALCACMAKGIEVRITQGFRTFAEQDADYAIGRTLPGKKITNARGGQSPHNYGLAVDVCIKHKDGSVSFDIHEDLDKDGIADWTVMVNEFKKLGCTWGGDWKGTLGDNDHFELLFGKSLVQLLAMYNTRQVDENGYVLLTPNNL